MADPVGVPDLHGARILVLEDDPDASEMIVEALRLCGARVWAAQMVEQARTLVAEVVPQLILCDLALPREDGISFVRWLRTQPLTGGGSAAVVAYTAYDDYFLRARCGWLRGDRQEARGSRDGLSNHRGPLAPAIAGVRPILRS
jgi:CheY-like chemotaxis protein